MDVKNIVAEGDYVVVQARAARRTTATTTATASSFALADGKVVEIDEYCDTELVTAAFGAKETRRTG